jgi:hypothetical protein
MPIFDICMQNTSQNVLVHYLSNKVIATYTFDTEGQSYRPLQHNSHNLVFRLANAKPLNNGDTLRKLICERCAYIFTNSSCYRLPSEFTKATLETLRFNNCFIVQWMNNLQMEGQGITYVCMDIKEFHELLTENPCHYVFNAMDLL